MSRSGASYSHQAAVPRSDNSLPADFGLATYEDRGGTWHEDSQSHKRSKHSLQAAARALHGREIDEDRERARRQRDERRDMERLEQDDANSFDLAGALRRNLPGRDIIDAATSRAADAVDTVTRTFHPPRIAAATNRAGERVGSGIGAVSRALSMERSAEPPPRQSSSSRNRQTSPAQAAPEPIAGAPARYSARPPWHHPLVAADSAIPDTLAPTPVMRHRWGRATWATNGSDAVTQFCDDGSNTWYGYTPEEM